jgi:hypothetical protein
MEDFEPPELPICGPQDIAQVYCSKTLVAYSDAYLGMIQIFRVITQILKPDNSIFTIFRGLSYFCYAFCKSRTFFKRTSILKGQCHEIFDFWFFS